MLNWFYPDEVVFRASKFLFCRKNSDLSAGCCYYFYVSSLYYKVLLFPLFIQKEV